MPVPSGLPGFASRYSGGQEAWRFGSRTSHRASAQDHDHEAVSRAADDD
jgi:hypothetical protein